MHNNKCKKRIDQLQAGFEPWISDIISQHTTTAPSRYAFKSRSCHFNLLLPCSCCYMDICYPITCYMYFKCYLVARITYSMLPEKQHNYVE